MPLSNKALKRREQAKDAANGVLRNDIEKRKLATAKPDVTCTVCGSQFKLTKRNVDARAHHESRHPQKPFDECFPEIVAAEAADAKPAAAGAATKAAAPKKKRDDAAALLAEGLAGAAATKGPAKKAPGR